jgi:hypothetical protein
MNYLINEGYQKAALNFAKEAGITPQVDFPAMDERINIRNDIHCGNIQSAIERINCLHPEVSHPHFVFSLNCTIFPVALIKQVFMHHSQTFRSVMRHNQSFSLQHEQYSFSIFFCTRSCIEA